MSEEDAEVDLSSLENFSLSPDWSSGKKSNLPKNNEAFNIGDISNDKRYLSLSKTYTRDNSDVYIYNFETNNLNKILSMETDVNHSSAGFSNDSKYLYYLTDYNSELKY